MTLFQKPRRQGRRPIEYYEDVVSAEEKVTIVGSADNNKQIATSKYACNTLQTKMGVLRMDDTTTSSPTNPKDLLAFVFTVHSAF